MPLPERPNVAEFTPTIEEAPQRRRAFRIRVVQSTILVFVGLISILLGLILLTQLLDSNKGPSGYSGTPAAVAFFKELERQTQIISFIRAGSHVLVGGLSFLAAVVWMCGNWRK